METLAGTLAAFAHGTYVVRQFLSELADHRLINVTITERMKLQILRRGLKSTEIA